MRLKLNFFKNFNRKTIFLIFMVVNFSLFFGMFLTYVNVFPLSCNNFFKIGYIFPMMALFIITIVTIIFGLKLRVQILEFS